MGIKSRFSGAQGDNLSLELFIGTVSQDIAKNTSTVRVWGTVSTNAHAYFDQPRATVTIRINGGGAIKKIPLSIGRSSKVTFFIEEYTIGHNADGTKRFDYSLALDTGHAIYGYAKSSGSYELQKIPRASSFSLSGSEIGKALDVSITRAVDSFKHKIRYALGQKSGDVVSNIDTSYQWVIPLNLCDQLPNSTAGQLTIYVDTYDGSTLIGTRSESLQVTVPDNVRPSLTGFTLTETNSTIAKMLLGNNYVQIMSNIAINFGQSNGIYGSTITGYRAEIVGKNLSVSDNNASFGMMNWSGSATVRATVIDSRGRHSNPIERVVNVLEYSPPTLSFSAIRSGSDLSTITVTRNAKISPLTVDGHQKNIMNLSFKVAQVGDENYVNNTSGASGIWQSISELINSNANLTGSFPANKAYSIIATLSDRFTQASFSVVVGTEQFPLTWDRDGIGVGKPREKGALDVKGESYFDGNISASGQITQSGKKVVLEDDATLADYRASKVVYQRQFSFPWGVKATAVRIGNSVTLSLDRGVYTIGQSYEYAIMGEKLPKGFRPAVDSILRAFANSGPSDSGGATFHLQKDGSIRLTNNITSAKVWSGTMTYLTTDNYPEFI